MNRIMIMHARSRLRRRRDSRMHQRRMLAQKMQMRVIEMVRCVSERVYF